LELKEQYLKALKLEITSKYRNEKLNTLYIGGGTPSTLTVNEIEQLLCLFDTEKDAEITIELNPETMSFEYFRGLKDIGINRVSLGCQTFNDDILKRIGRRHNSQQAIDAVAYAKDAGFKNISMDFIYGLPNQTLQDFSSDLNKAISLGVTHISLYGLKIDEGCYFYEHRPENIANDDIQADMYLNACKIMKENDFLHYEISNFAKKGCESRHNLNYWYNNSYYGFGVAAHGYIEGVRYANKNELGDYIKNPLICADEHKITQREMLEEEIFLGLRKSKGLDISAINRKFGIDFKEKYSNVIDKYQKSGYLNFDGNICNLTESGILVSNVILVDFLD
jgi:oxygen-independent coproporphyrinogen-3 oxidase